MSELIYTEVVGGTTYVTGKRGVTTALHRNYGETVGVLVKEDEGGMFYVAVGAKVGERGDRHEVKSVRPLSMKKFDRLMRIDLIRHSLGWRA